MSVLDPFEVLSVEVWPLVEYQDGGGSGANRHLDALERQVFVRLVAESRFGKILNEKDPPEASACAMPPSIKADIVPAAVRHIRAHPDVRIARRAMTIARLSQIIAGRKVQVGLRRTLTTQADRLAWLAAARFEALGGDTAVEKEDPDAGEES